MRRNTQALADALTACINAVAATSPPAIEAAAKRAGLSQREATMLSTMRGQSVAGVARYVAAKKRGL